MLQKIKKSIDYINSITSVKPSIGIVLGSGLGAFSEDFIVHSTIPYATIPYFPVSGIDGHEGKLLFTHYEGKNLVIMQGRIHYYEGYTMKEVTYPVRIMKYLGVEKILLSNAAGGMNPEYSIGDLMIIADHINLMPNPLIGEHFSELGPRFPDMSTAYDDELIIAAEKAALEYNIDLKKGCYVAVTGPTYETPAEYNYLRKIGGDVVGMSTVPEVIVARQMGMECFAASVITDLGVPGAIEVLSHEMVKDAAEKAEPDLAAIFKRVIQSC